jgi:hypothetical protein
MSKTEMQTYMLIVHVDADSKEQAIEHVERRARLASLGGELSTGERIGYRFVHIETLEGYCNACESRCEAQNCPRRE